ncbi:MFS transporter [Glutamicibacter uratoxydans]|uniref:MFS transporter n=1 Tax=Glutamicibacter uratoxydans TaxID=43667 RepID=A0A4Y4DPQ4_GLUUR|nr:MFS transporter [Glutamicibacter uratoxydans]
MIFLAIATVVLMGINLRVGVVSASALFNDLQNLQGYGAFISATLPTIPVLCFAVAGSVTVWVTRKIGLERAMLLAILLLTIGLSLRAVESTAMLIAGTIISMSGLAVCNVSLPSFVRKHFPERTSLLTSTYTICMSLGAAVASAVAVPIAQQLSSPLLGLAVWAVLALIAVIPMVPIAIKSKKPAAVKAVKHHSPWPLLATRNGLLITGLFTVQALLVYSIVSWLPSMLVSRGMNSATAGLMLGILQFISIPAIALVMSIASRPRLLRTAFMIATGSSLVGFLSLPILPTNLSIISVVFLGIGFTVFPLVMLSISRSGESVEASAAMSTLAQTVGYLVAAAGPFVLGLLASALGGWTLPMWLLLGFAVAQLLLAYLLSSGVPRRAALEPVDSE